MGTGLFVAIGMIRSRALVLGLSAVPCALFGQGTISGSVLDSLGSALSGAQVTIQGTNTRAVTDDDGVFRLGRVQEGDADLYVRRLGYRPESRKVHVTPGGEIHLDVTLVPLAVRLATVEVRRRPEAYDSRLAGYNSRKGSQVGHFVTREQLDRMSSPRFVDALREIPGVQMRSLRGGGTTIILRGSRCPPLVFIDGFPADAGVMDLDMLDLSGVEGIEIYSGVATVPSEFMGARGTHSCGVVAVWSRPTRPRKQRLGSGDAVDLEKLLDSHAVYTADQVDDPAGLVTGSAAPTYPDSLWRARVPGRVVAEFVVDVAGLIEPGSLRMVSTTHPYFSGAVKTALESAAFRPAVLGGKPVRQIVQLPFVFDPAKAPGDTTLSPGG
ncbi:MAG TPA: carboxypeptidase regulatory-like domain-containing protein [Gemmatimonadaceae bacterium]